MIEEVCFFKYLILRDSYFHRKLSCVKINITLESSSSGDHSLHRREENSMKENKKSVSTRRVSSHCKTSKEKQEDFIMLPGKEYTDLMEMHILELSKLPPEEKNETSLLQWMRFLGGKTRKDFEKMAKKNSELEEAYDVLDKLSADEKKRLEYETRQRAIRDYNIGMLTAERRGIENGRKIGIEEGRAEINQLILELSKLGRTEDITKAAADKEYQRKLLKEFGLH